MLALLNNHPRDKNIQFEEEGHKYTVLGRTDFTSVTTTIKKFFNAFDADKVLNKLTRFGVFEKKYPGKTIEQVKREWNENGRTASARGTRLHQYIEFFFNGIDTPYEEYLDLDIEVNMFYDFAAQLAPNMTPYRTEWYIFDEVHKLAGSIDMIFRVDPADARRVAIYDWKCSKEIKYSNKYEKSKSPIAHLEDCNYNHYSLQLNLYKYILEKRYGLVVVEMMLVIIHRNFSSFNLVAVKDMQREIGDMLRAL